MCLVVLAYKVHPAFPLIVLANRDEFLDRPALPAHAWQDAPHIFAGRDVQAGGTWLGVTRSGRFAALTNYRDLTVVPRNGPSRGALVRRALDQDIAAADTVEYERFNLIHGEVDAL
ncbi:MAG: NRDE family protein, partial [Flavobacteriales bacterium]|nr:NRDE family protein [Flavobacteriales bacterium]